MTWEDLAQYFLDMDKEIAAMGRKVRIGSCTWRELKTGP
jgi:hypothetical protein